MNSPFPGMDPFLESHWRDVQTSMMTYIRDQIQDQLPPDLVARVEESVSVDFAEESPLIVMSVHSRTRTAVFGASLREPLPVIPIPLRPHDHDAQLNIQEVVKLVYDRGRYWKLNYQSDPEPLFAPEDAMWVDSLLRSNLRRQ